MGESENPIQLQQKNKIIFFSHVMQKLIPSTLKS